MTGLELLLIGLGVIFVGIPTFSAILAVLTPTPFEGDRR